ncbi:MAG TPA: hypothetical protein VKU60_01070 [Chloroflexota bacterium]|nr:hypothetical protein [Chloroflexota bacterium]
MKKPARKLKLTVETLQILNLAGVPGGGVSGAPSCIHSCNGTCGPCTTA